MSRAAYERVVERVMGDPATRMPEGRARQLAGRAAERADRTPQGTPLTREQNDERAEGVRPYTRTARVPIDTDSEAHFDLSRADGTAPPRAAFHERVTDDDRKAIREFGQRREARLKEMLTRA